mmetsp:Transcript_34228/g.61740  ORF Transcript_34228/g.61740 Transcript_34228/m.61740 type:complete len:319 (+) Transcript_34228:1317-2273(+)
MGGANNIGAAEERVTLELRGLRRKDIKGGTSDDLSVQGANKGLIVNDTTTSDVNNATALLHLGEGGVIEDTLGTGGQGHVEGVEIACGEGLLKLDELDTLGGGLLDRGIGIACDDVHAESTSATGDLTADLAKAVDGNGLASKGDTDVGVPVPLALLNGSIGLGNIAGKSADKSNTVLSGSNSVGSGGIDNKATVFSGSSEVNIVNTDTGATNNLQPALGSFEDLASNLGSRADDEGVSKRNLLAKLVGSKVVGAVNISGVLEHVDTSISELLSDKDGGLTVAGNSRHLHGPSATEDGGLPKRDMASAINLSLNSLHF